MQFVIAPVQVNYLNDDEAVHSVRPWTSYDEHYLKIDLLMRLLEVGAVRPGSVPVATVRDWFPTRERDLADALVADLVSNPDAPVEYVTSEERAMWLVDAGATRAFVADLRRNPPWFDR